jgi:sRNA-binding regulator protein Hfq
MLGIEWGLTNMDSSLNEYTYYQARMGQEIFIAFLGKEHSGFQGRLIGFDQHYVFLESLTEDRDVYMISKRAIEYVRPPMTGG